MKRLYVLITLFLICSLAYSQKAERRDIRQGNKMYEKESYTESEVAYRKALDVDSHSPEATYNLGNSLYKQEKAKEALEQYQVYLSGEKDPKKQASAWHNMGNVCMQGQDYANAVLAYKQSLRRNPQDNETRYNLAMAQTLLKKQQQQQQQQQQQDNKEEKKEQQEQPQEQQANPQNEQNEQQEQPDMQEQQEQLSQEKAQQLLDALMQDEEELQEKVKKLQMQQGQRSQTDKDW